MLLGMRLLNICIAVSIIDFELVFEISLRHLYLLSRYTSFFYWYVLSRLFIPR